MFIVILIVKLHSEANEKEFPNCKEIAGNKMQEEEKDDTRSSRKSELDISESDSLNNGSSIAISLQNKKTNSVEELAKEMDCLFLAETLVETPVKKSIPKVNNRVTPSVIAGSYSSSRIVLETPIKTPSGLSIKHRSTPIQSDSMKKPAMKPVKSKTTFVASSPVGMYIRSLPETILIENVRSAPKMKQISCSPMTKPVPVAVKNKQGRWSVARASSVATKENRIQSSDLTDIKPVLPTVLHEAAATLVNLILQF